MTCSTILWLLCTMITWCCAELTSDVITTLKPLTGAARCCENGGRCILKSFCLCPKGYSGRQCQYRHGTESCAPAVPHESWVRSDCDLCFCWNGKLSCQKRLFAGCENEKEKDLDPLDESRDLEIWPPEHKAYVTNTVTDNTIHDVIDDREDYYYYDSETSNHSHIVRSTLISYLLYFVLLCSSLIFHT